MLFSPATGIKQVFKISGKVQGGSLNAPQTLIGFMNTIIYTSSGGKNDILYSCAILTLQILDTFVTDPVAEPEIKVMIKI